MSKSATKFAFVVFILSGISITLFLWIRSGYSNAEQSLTLKKSKVPGVREQYLNYCAGCHGENLERFDQSEWMDARTDDAAFKSIKFGLEEMGMPAFQDAFTDQEIMALAKYIRDEVPKDHRKRIPAFSSERIVQSQKQKFIIDTIVEGLEVPWGMEFLPNGDLIISERSGILYRLSKGNLTKIEGLPDIWAVNQGGLLDLRLHPDYEQNGWLYFAYSEPSENHENVGNTSIMRARISGNTLTDQEKIFDGKPDSPKTYHWGCKLLFDKDGYLWFGVGDRGERDVYPQRLNNHNGKIHRIHDDGSIPYDNPFIDTEGAMPSIYSFGHRNPQGTSLHPETGEIWITEHGPKGGDELNIIKPGANYGWPVISYGINYDGTVFTDITHKKGMEQPVIYWDPSIAPCGMTFVDSDRYPAWKNNILVGALRAQCLERIELDGHEVIAQERLLEGIGRIRNVAVSPDGFIYVAIEKPGFIVKLLPVN
ncbi:MAG: PQQ-dependent sugar dehydrogenase [Bacteroidales bacterium]|jgi:glucose/arabinose dehydrogenase|nr:PQQ-dependent sugar dehydrogenase [Bacteroidales bacterium]